MLAVLVFSNKSYLLLHSKFSKDLKTIAIVEPLYCIEDRNDVLKIAARITTVLCKYCSTSFSASSGCTEADLCETVEWCLCMARLLPRADSLLFTDTSLGLTPTHNTKHKRPLNPLSTRFGH